MANETEKNNAGKVVSALTVFLSKNRTILIICVAVVVLALAGLWIGLSVSASVTEKNQARIDTLQEQFNTWLTLEDKTTAEAEQAVQDLTTGLEELSKKGNKYPAVKSLYLLGLMKVAQESYQEALDYFIASAENAKDTYLAPLSLMNAAVCYEQLSDAQKALETYQSVYDRFGSDTPEAPKALFNVARLHEKANTLDLAKAVFQQLADEFPSSEYAKLARSRLVTMQ
ncbi:MAG: tetratricopeptide repeat protein [Sphaerochaetaceae bacterium]